MSISNSIVKNAAERAGFIQNNVLDIAYEMNIDELYQIKTRLITSVNNLSNSVTEAFSLSNRLDRIRSFVLITGKMLECRDYLQLVNKLRITDTSKLMEEIDELTNLLMINSGSLN